LTEAVATSQAFYKKQKGSDNAKSDARDASLVIVPRKSETARADMAENIEDAAERSKHWFGPKMPSEHFFG